MDPLSLLRAAVSDVPSLKYAYAALALFAVLAIAGTWALSPLVAVTGIPALLALMFVLAVFAQISKKRSPIQRPMLFLVWFYVTATVLVTTLLVSVFFFRWPTSLPNLLRLHDAGPEDELGNAIRAYAECAELERIPQCAAPRQHMLTLVERASR